MINLHIVPNTGVQYVTLPSLDRSKARAFQQEFMQGGDFTRVRPSTSRVRLSDVDHDEEPQGDYRTAIGCPASILDVVEDRDGMWIPIPIDRSGCWVCVFLKPDGDNEYRAVIALDTTLVQQGNPQGIEQGEDASRSIAPCSRAFWSQPCVREYFVHLRRSMQPSIDRRKLREMSETELQRSVIGLAGFLGAYGLVIRLEDCPSTDAPGPVGVDVAIDIGNSRTCVLIKESIPGEDSRPQRLQLVYPSNPTQEAECPFSTQSAFVEHEVLPSSIQSRESFHFLSVLQLGPAAASRLRNATFDPRPLGLSSPKRYLWDDCRSIDWEWSLSDRQGAEGRPEHLRGSILSRMDVHRPLKDPVIPPAIPNHPRLACTVWTVVEILEQAFRQANSIAWRRADTNAPHSSRRREILNLAITFPAGMHSREIDNYRRACERASRLWAEFRTNPHLFAGSHAVPKDPRHGVKAPAVHMVCDEGLSVQACWLYGMVVHTYGADVRALLASLGRCRGPERQHSLRMASIDIGGGTIDVSISQYSEDPDRGGHAALRCRRLFTFGVSRAGDEVVRALLERQVFLPIVRECLGGDPSAWNRVISENNPADLHYPILRRQCVRNLWMPIAMCALERVELGGVARVRLGEVPGIEVETLERLERELARHGTIKVPLASLEVKLDQADLRWVVKESIGRTLSQCADVIDQYSCDVLVVGGKPSSLRAVREAITNSMPVPPGQIFFLSEMPVEDWYPFVRLGGKISDAKTCGVFGGLVAFDALRGATTMSIVPDPAGPLPSSGPFIGVARAADARGPLVLERDDQFDRAGTVDRHVGPMVGAVIVMRRINDSGAEANQIYEYQLKRDVRHRLDRSPTRAMPVRTQFSIRQTVTADRPGRSAIELGGDTGADVVEAIASGPIPVGGDQAIDASEAMELVFKTMSDIEGHWIDTGHFGMLAVEDV